MSGGNYSASPKEDDELGHDEAGPELKMLGGRQVTLFAIDDIYGEHNSREFTVHEVLKGSL